MAGERMVPLLPCAVLDESVEFYEALGFERTYLQRKPNPHAVVERGDIAVHLFGMDGFVPADSYGSVLIVTPDCDLLHTQLLDALRTARGRVPREGIPRVLRPNKRNGVVKSFSIVDPGGNWLRFTQGAEGDTEQVTGLERVIENALRVADGKGDEEHALRLVLTGLERWPDAKPEMVIDALVIQASLEIRTGRVDEARTTVEVARALSEANDGHAADEIAEISGR